MELATVRGCVAAEEDGGTVECKDFVHLFNVLAKLDLVERAVRAFDPAAEELFFRLGTCVDRLVPVQQQHVVAGD